MKHLLSKRRRSQFEDTDLDMVPIMNMFLVLIPFLLMSVSFLQLKAINTSVPVLGDKKTVPDGKSSIQITVVARLTTDHVDLSLLSEELDPVELSKWQKAFPVTGGQPAAYERLAAHLRLIKEMYPKSDTLILIPDPTVLYENIIQTMDIARASTDGPLFPNVVLSGKVG